jgi:ATP-dependent DNA helicase RecQ
MPFPPDFADRIVALLQERERLTSQEMAEQLHTAESKVEETLTEELLGSVKKDAEGYWSLVSSRARAVDRARCVELLRTAVGRKDIDFRDGQWEAIESVCSNLRRTLVVQRTGWGKSSVYFIATRVLRDRDCGPTIIVSPLLALMRNQIEAAERLGIRAVTINSTNKREWDEIKFDILSNNVDAMLISPERLGNAQFVNQVLMPVADSIGLMVIDEAHCISDWGHDFRPDYRRLVNIIKQLPPNMPVLCTTATANDRVVDDIVAQIGEVTTSRGPLAREGLSLYALELPDQARRLAWLAENIPQLEGTGIVYVLTKRDAETVCDWLNKCGIKASPYYSGVEHDGFEDSTAYRLHLEEKLLNNEVKVLVATTALGMGYDKPDLGFVIHFQAASSVVSYYQQVGRAGRAIDSSFGVLLYGTEDEEIHEHFRNSAFPNTAQVKAILDALEDSDGLTIKELDARVNLRRSRITSALKFLEVETKPPVVRSGSVWQRTAIRYELPVDRIRFLTGRKEAEWQQIQDYIGVDTCRMQFLQRALDDPEVEPCGYCQNCVNEPKFSAETSFELANKAADHLRQLEIPIEPRKQTIRDACGEYGLPFNLGPLVAQWGRVLSRWGDAGWGELVKEDKHEGYFRDELVKASADMISRRWRPRPAPEWVTCIPSQRHPELVPDFAVRLARQMGIEFRPIIKKVKNNDPQKLQENSFYQCRNLDGAFEIQGNVPSGPVLLIDDIVDSRWTMTIAAALLRQQGSGPVFPFALATTNGSL